MDSVQKKRSWWPQKKSLIFLLHICLSFFVLIDFWWNCKKYICVYALLPISLAVIVFQQKFIAMLCDWLFTLDLRIRILGAKFTFIEPKQWHSFFLEDFFFLFRINFFLINLSWKLYSWICGLITEIFQNL